MFQPGPGPLIPIVLRNTAPGVPATTTTVRLLTATGVGT
jgi:hypothetical protein